MGCQEVREEDSEQGDANWMEVGGKVGDEEYSGEGRRVSNTRGQKKVESQNGDNVDADAGKADVDDVMDADVEKAVQDNCDNVDVDAGKADFDDNMDADADSDIDADVEKAVQDNCEKDDVDIDGYKDVGAAADDDYDSSDEY